MNPIRVCIIGTGAIARAHLEALKQAGEKVQVLAAADVDRERVEAFCRELGIPRAYTDNTRMLAVEKPGLVHICTPPATHCELSVQCLEAGAWAFCEKPLCGSLAEMDRIEAAEKKTGRFCSSVFQWRFGSGGKHLRKLIESNAMGRPLVASCQTTWYRNDAYYEVPWRGKWATELGGPTMGLGIHLMDFLLWLMGDWQEVHSVMDTLERRIEVEDVSMAIVRFENGVMASVINSALCPRQETVLRLDFQKCTVEVKSLYSYTNANWCYTPPRGAANEEEVASWKTLPTEVPSTHASQLAAILENMECNERPLVSGTEARRTIEFLTALYKSAVTGKAVRRGSIVKKDPFYRSLHGSKKPVWK